jgi:hypothetical protein
MGSSSGLASVLLGPLEGLIARQGGGRGGAAFNAYRSNMRGQYGWMGQHARRRRRGGIGNEELAPPLTMEPEGGGVNPSDQGGTKFGSDRGIRKERKGFGSQRGF